MNVFQTVLRYGLFSVWADFFLLTEGFAPFSCVSFFCFFYHDCSFAAASVEVLVEHSVLAGQSVQVPHDARNFSQKRFSPTRVS